MAAPRDARDRSLVWPGALALVGLAAGVVLAAARRLGDFDLGWHLALGRALFARRALPFADDFSFTVRGQRAPDELLADATLYLASRLGGAVGLELLALACIALLAWLLVLRARPAPWPLAVAFAGLALVAASPWLVVRPAIFSFPLLAALLAVVDAHRRTQRGLWRAVPLELLWSNLHPFAALGVPLLGAYAAYVAACRLARGRAGALLPTAEGAAPARAAAVALAAFAASLVSPFGLRLYTASFAMSTSTLGGVRAVITEWTPTTPAFLARYDVAVVVIAALALVGLVARRASAYDAGLFLLAVLLGARAVRLLPLTAVILAPLAARSLAPLLARVRPAAAAALVVAIGLATPPAIAATPGLRAGVGFDEANLPEGAARFIAAARPSGAMWNFLPFGGWLTWRLYPDVHVFIDGRTAHLYPPAFVEAYARAEHDAGEFARLADAWQLQWAVVRARPGELFGEPIARDRRWVMVYLDDCAAVYVRADGPNRALAADGYQLLRHLTRPPSAPVAPALRAALRHDAALALRQSPSSLRAQALAAAARMR